MLIYDFNYTGSVQRFVVESSGKYKLECWGAQGGTYDLSSKIGGFGGYSVGEIKLTKGTELYIYVGGQPARSTTIAAGGFNGGGSSLTYSYDGTTTYGQAGGGASDIRIGQDSLYSRVIVAGGGGGSTNVFNASVFAYGGGEVGGVGDSTYPEYQATQSKPGENATFGYGANATGPSNYKYGGAGGGGGWYGGGTTAQTSNTSNIFTKHVGGGSGYVFTETTKQYYPKGCLLNASHLLTNASTVGGNNRITLPDGTTRTGNSGNGAVRITLLDIIVENTTSVYIKAGGVWKQGKVYIKDSGIWKEATRIKTNINGTWS